MSRFASSKDLVIQLEDGIGVLRVFGVVALALGVVIDQRLGLVRGELVGVLHGLLGVATFPLDGAERIERGIDRTLEDRLGQVVPVETHGVADVHGGELARQRGERDVEVDAKEVAVLRAVHDNLGVELGGHVRADLAHEQHRDDDAREHGDDASGNRALGHVLRDLPVEVHALEPRLTHQARHLARSAEERADASRGVRAGGPPRDEEENAHDTRPSDTQDVDRSPRDARRRPAARKGADRVDRKIDPLKTSMCTNCAWGSSLYFL